MGSVLILQTTFQFVPTFGLLHAPLTHTLQVVPAFRCYGLLFLPPPTSLYALHTAAFLYLHGSYLPPHACLACHHTMCSCSLLPTFLGSILPACALVLYLIPVYRLSFALTLAYFWVPSCCLPYPILPLLYLTPSPHTCACYLPSSTPCSLPHTHTHGFCPQIGSTTCLAAFLHSHPTCIHACLPPCHLPAYRP